MCSGSGANKPPIFKAKLFVDGDLIASARESNKRKLQKRSLKGLYKFTDRISIQKQINNKLYYVFLYVNPRTVVYLFDQKPMMIKHTLSLSIDNSDDDWVCVHTNT